MESPKPQQPQSPSRQPCRLQPSAAIPVGFVPLWNLFLLAHSNPSSPTRLPGCQDAGLARAALGESLRATCLLHYQGQAFFSSLPALLGNLHPLARFPSPRLLLSPSEGGGSEHESNARPPPFVSFHDRGDEGSSRRARFPILLIAISHIRAPRTPSLPPSPKQKRANTNTTQKKSRDTNFSRQGARRWCHPPPWHLNGT